MKKLMMIMVAVMLLGFVSKAQDPVQSWNVRIINDNTNAGIAVAKNASGQIDLKTKTWPNTDKGIYWTINKYADGNYTICADLNQGKGYFTCTYDGTAPGSTVWFFPGNQAEPRKAPNRQWKIKQYDGTLYTINNAVSDACLKVGEGKMILIRCDYTRKSLWYFLDDDGNRVTLE